MKHIRAENRLMPIYQNKTKTRNKRKHKKLIIV